MEMVERALGSAPGAMPARKKLMSMPTRMPIKTSFLKILLLAAAACGPLPPSQVAAQTISYTGGTLTENFDSMGPAGTNTPPGWFVGYASTTNRTTVGTSDGSVAPNGTAGWNFGTANGTNRALGTMATHMAAPAPSAEFRIKKHWPEEHAERHRTLLFLSGV